MKIFSRKKNESLIIDDQIIVTVLDVRENYVRLRICGPNAAGNGEHETIEVTVPAQPEKRPAARRQPK